MKRKIIYGFLIICGLVLLYAIGPKPPLQEIQIKSFNIPDDLNALQDKINADKSVIDLKPDNESRIIWADSIRKTEYCLLYLPGFTATYMEGEPLHKNIAKKYGWNLYLPRTVKTGLNDSDAYKDLSISDLLNSAEEAYGVAKKLGDKVIIMSCSTGGTLSLYLASKYPEIAGLLMYSPNVKLGTPFAPLMSGPWGLQIAKLAHGGQYRSYEQSDEYKKYWYTNYRVESVLTLQQLLERIMTEETFEKVTSPLYVAYYYKSEDEMDNVVSIDAIKHMFEKVSTPNELKIIESFENAGHHAMISKLTSNDMQNIEQRLIKYLDDLVD
ncbi:MAG: alpha/beta hydrolase [Flavobacteriales bacterium]|nr:alpha/beta hydrolase [Flavobacteriales bacterium]